MPVLQSEKRVLIIAPVGRDAETMAAVLHAEQIATSILSDLPECRAQITAGAGVLLLTEEAFKLPGSAELLDGIKTQPAWSDLPLIILTSGGEPRVAILMQSAASAAGSVTLLERPMTPVTLLRSVQVALRSRRRQYQVRDLLAEQERQQHELRESKQRYERQVRLFEGIASTTPDFVYLFDVHGRFLYANRRLLEVWGMQLPQVIGKTFRELGYEQWHHDRHMHEIAQVIETRQPIKGEVPFKAPLTGIFGVYEYIFTPVLDPQGDVEIIAGTTRDVTERKQAEDALRAAHHKLQTVIDSISDGLVVMDRQWHFTFFSEQAARILGVRREDMLGKVVWDLFPHARGTKFYESYHRAVETGQPQSFEEFYPEPLNQWLECRCYPSEEGLTVYFHDVTDRRRAQDAAAELQRKLDSALLAGEVATFEWRVPEDQLWGDRNFCRLFGIPADTTGAAPLARYIERIHPDDRADVLQRVHRTVETAGSYQAEYRIVSDSRTRWVVARGNGERDGTGQVLRISGVLLDITARKEMEQRIEASLHEKDVLLREIHHRVKNNMQVISSLISLQSTGIQQPAVREALQDVRDRVRSMAMVHEKLYRSENLARIDFADYARSLMAYLWRAHGGAASNIRLTLDLNPATLEIDTAVSCGLILSELSTNALKHAFRGRASGEVTVAVRHDPGRFALHVRDDGVGLPFNWRETGSLGLRLVQMLAGQLKATLEVKQGPGTEFVIALPVSPHDPTAATQP